MSETKVYFSNCCGVEGKPLSFDLTGRCPACKDGCLFEENKDIALGIGKEYEVLTRSPDVWNKAEYLGFSKEVSFAKRSHRFKGENYTFCVLSQDLNNRVREIKR